MHPVDPQSLEQQMSKYQVTLESYEGECKRVTVLAASAEDAMGAFMFGKWIAVDCKKVG
jgi:hypothetical protein